MYAPVQLSDISILNISLEFFPSHLLMDFLRGCDDMGVVRLSTVICFISLLIFVEAELTKHYSVLQNYGWLFR
jgi:hypothetical protein